MAFSISKVDETVSWVCHLIPGKLHTSALTVYPLKNNIPGKLHLHSCPCNYMNMFNIVTFEPHNVVYASDSII